MAMQWVTPEGYVDLLRQAGRKVESRFLLQQIARENLGSAAAREATKRYRADEIYELAHQEKHREVVAAIDDLEKLWQEAKKN